MAKIARKLLAHYINAAPPVEGQPAAEAVYVRLGKDLEEYNPELSAEVESKKNILGESSINISSYEKTGSVEPYYAEKGDALFERLQAILDEGLVLDDLLTDVVDVKLWETKAANGYPAVKEEAYIEVKSYGGDTTGYQIPFDLHYTGVKTKGYFDTATKTFKTEAGA